MAKGAIITEKVFASIMILHEANPELNNTQIGSAFKVDASTVGKMIKCGTWEKYGEYKKDKAEKGRIREQARKTETQTVELFSGDEKIADEQIEMQLDPEEEILDQKQEAGTASCCEQVKMMRFQAAQADKIIMKLNQLNDTMNMILRAIRRV